MKGGGGSPPDAASPPASSTRSPGPPGPQLLPAPSLRHLKELSGPFGLFEHARGAKARPECGYCTDDNGRALALACRAPGDPYAEELAHQSLAFVERAHLGSGRFRLRQDAGGHWTPEPPSDDAAGRALLGLGVAAATAPWEAVREGAEALFVQAAAFRSSWPRAAAYAALGAAEVAASPHTDRSSRQAALRLLAETAEHMPGPARTSGQPAGRPLGPGEAPGRPSGAPGREDWRWPEARLTYANALLPAAQLAAGEVLGHEGLVAGGLDLLCWLVEEEWLEGHFSFTPVGGRGPSGPKPAWDQQPVEAAAMAQACAMALRLSGQDRWQAALEAALGWWLGRNDGGVLMWDPATDGGYDGLGPAGVNTNQGAESTIAFVGAMALAQAQAFSASSRLGTEAVAAPTQRSAAP